MIGTKRVVGITCGIITVFGSMCGIITGTICGTVCGIIIGMGYGTGIEYDATGGLIDSTG